MTVVVTAFWRRLDVPGRGAARISQSASGYQLLGQSVFLDSRGPTALRYMLDLHQLETVKVVRCDAVAVRILGLSLAGWNAVASLGLVAGALAGARQPAAT